MFHSLRDFLLQEGGGDYSPGGGANHQEPIELTFPGKLNFARTLVRSGLDKLLMTT